MTDLPPELKAAGWKPISEIRQTTFNNDDKVELILVDKQGRKSRPSIEIPADVIEYAITADYRDPDMFRRLIPVTPDTIVLNRVEAENVLDAIDLALQAQNMHLVEDEYRELFNNIKTQLEALKQKSVNS